MVQVDANKTWQKFFKRFGVIDDGADLTSADGLAWRRPAHGRRHPRWRRPWGPDLGNSFTKRADLLLLSKKRARFGKKYSPRLCLRRRQPLFCSDLLSAGLQRRKPCPSGYFLSGLHPPYRLADSNSGARPAPKQQHHW